MLKKITRKTVVAVLAVVIAGIVYCVFFAEEKDGTVQYQTGEETEDSAEAENDAPTGDAENKRGQNSAEGQGSGTLQNIGNSKNSVTGQGSATESNQGIGKENGEAQENRQQLIYVHVCGAVKNPAVYALPDGARVCDAIAKAGGLTETAADDYVNQARFLTDGERVYIPEKDELSNLSATQYAAGQLVSDTGQSQGNGSTTDSQQIFPVNINTAGISELTTLPGIGESRAESIITYRETHGAFSRIEDIMKISGIKGAAYEKIKDKICTGNE